MPPDQTSGRTEACDDERPWFVARTYVHFDPAPSRDFAIRYCEDPEKVARHAFWPFLGYELVERRFKREGDDRFIHSKERPIKFAAHMDAHIMARYAFLLRAAYEEAASPEVRQASLAYRKLGKSNIDFAKDAFDEVRRRGSCVALCFDVKDFFDSLDHADLKRQWARVLGSDRLPPDHYSVYEAVTRWSNVPRESALSALGLDEQQAGHRARLCSPAVFADKIRGNGLVEGNPATKGVPQGAPISAALSNIYMLDFDAEMTAEAARRGAYYRRYSDDILVICAPEHEASLRDAVTRGLSRLKLTPAADKLERTVFARAADGGLRVTEASRRDGAMQYLGFTFDGVRVLVRGKSIARFHRKMRNAVRAAEISARKSGRPMGVRQIYAGYSHLGRRSFVRYALRAADVHQADSIRRQVAGAWGQLAELLEAAR